MRIGVDTGGTFTDVVRADGTIAKVPSTPDDAARAVAESLTGSPVSVLAHGTTVATNAVLEGRFAPVALLTTAGLEDVIEIARQNRPSLYDQFADRPPPLVPRHRRLGMAGRLDAAGAEIEPVGPVPEVPAEVDAIAVCLLHADLSDRHERAVAEELRAHSRHVVCSSELSPEFREYERTVTTVVDAGLGPVCRQYLGHLSGLAPEVLVMASSGGLVSLPDAVEHPARLLVSGPAAGVRAAADVAAANGFARAVSFDMGGTSTDVCLIDGGLPQPAPSITVGGYPVRLPALAIHTIGAGGGSIAARDGAGAVTVGPRSAGARPGPACYGLGGELPTVTDADLVLGRIPHGTELAGIGRLDVDRARAALDAASVSAEDVVRVVDAAMTEAVRVVTVAEGTDPRDCALVAFGGAGPVHAVAVAEALGMPAVIVPARAGVFSAVGLMTAPEQVDLVESVPAGTADPMRMAGELARRAVELLPGAESVVSFDCRYVGQSHELNVASPEAFHAEHERRNGYRRDDRPIEVVAVRAKATRPSPVRAQDLAAEPPAPVVGPAVVARPDCTVWVPNGWAGEAGAAGALILRRDESAPRNDAPVSENRRDTRHLAEGFEAGDRDARSDAPVSEYRRETRHLAEGLGASEVGGADLAVLLARLRGIAEEMGVVLRRAAYSPNIKERADSSCAVFAADGRLLVQAEHIPVHLGAMPASVHAVRSHLARIGDTPEPGAHYVVNDPFEGGTHLNDLTVVSPVHRADELVGWVANRAHHADVGGAAPGSMPADATEIVQEGLRIPPMRLTAEVQALLLANSRTPDERRGDLDAQVGANVVGALRLAELALTDAATAAVLDHGATLMRRAIAAAPDGRWTFADQLDSGGPGGAPVRVMVTLTIAGDTLEFDFTGSGPQQPGSVNAVEAVTVSSALFAARAVLGPDVPANAGSMAPIRVVAPPGSVVAARPPAAVAAGNVEVSQRVADVCLGALAQALPDRVAAAGQGTMNNLLLGFAGGAVYYETVAGGQGARPGRDGMSGVHTAMTNTLNTPIEALERAYPVRVRRLRLREGSGGAGRWRGGDGIERDVEVLEPAVLSLITERRTSRPYGLAGGAPGATGENWLLPDGDGQRAERLGDKVTRPVHPGDVIRVRTPGGGGWGEPT